MLFSLAVGYCQVTVMESALVALAAAFVGMAGADCGVVETSLDSTPLPEALTARSLYLYSVPLRRPPATNWVVS